MRAGTGRAIELGAGVNWGAKTASQNFPPKWRTALIHSAIVWLSTKLQSVCKLEAPQATGTVCRMMIFLEGLLSAINIVDGGVQEDPGSGGME